MSSLARAIPAPAWARERGDATLLAGTALAALLAAAAWTVLAYETSLVQAIAVPVGVGVVVLVIWRPMTGVYMGLLAVPLERLGFASGGADVTPAKALFVLTGIVAAGRLATSRQPGRTHFAFAAFAGLLLVMALGLTATDDTFTTVKILIQWTAYLCMAMLIAGSGIEQVKRIAACLAVSGAALGIVAVATAKTQSVVSGGQAATNRAQAGFEHPAILAFFLVLAFSPAVVLGFKARPALRVPLLAGAGMAVAGIMLSLARSGIIGVVVSLLILLWWPPFRRFALVLIVAVAIFAAFNLGAIQRSPEIRVIGQRLQTVTQTQATADNERVLIWAKTPAIVADHPFIGIGAGNFQNVSPKYGIVDALGLPFIHAHDIFLTIAAESGLIGLAFLLAFLGGLITEAVRVIARYRASPLFPYALGFAAGLAGLIVCGIADNPPSTLVIMAVFMVEVGAFLAAQRLVRAGAEPEPDAPA